MKVTAIIGSIRNGNSFTMVNSVKDIFSKSDVDLDVVHLKDLTFSFCNGCLECDETGLCVQDDDMNAIVKKVLNSDGLILASPTRWSLLSGEMKTFMDRLNPLAAHELLTRKKGLIFTVGQTNKEDDASVQLAANSMIAFCENAGIDVVETVLAQGFLEENAICEGSEILTKCKKAAEHLIAIIGSKKCQIIQ